MLEGEKRNRGEKRGGERFRENQKINTERKSEQFRGLIIPPSRKKERVKKKRVRLVKIKNKKKGVRLIKKTSERESKRVRLSRKKIVK